MTLYAYAAALPGIDARNASSIDFAPTIANYLGLPNDPSHFLGSSIFTRNADTGFGWAEKMWVISDAGLIDVTRTSVPRLLELKALYIDIRDMVAEGNVWPPKEMSEVLQ